MVSLLILNRLAINMNTMQGYCSECEQRNECTGKNRTYMLRTVILARQYQRAMSKKCFQFDYEDFPYKIWEMINIIDKVEDDFFSKPSRKK